MTSSSVTAQGLDQIAALLARVTDDRLDDPTPCEDWTVRDLVDHVVNTTDQLATMAGGGEIDWSAPTPHHDDPSAAFAAHRASLLSALETADGTLPEGMPAAEFAVHAWDLSTALGLDSSELDPEVAEAGHAFMSASLTDEQRGQAFAPEKPAPEGADPYQRLAAFAGRDV